MSGAQTEGLRARKKRAAREAIAATARRLFAERGFDAVTVAEIAAAADVSEKTVFNHFPTKEDLAFAGREQGIARLVADITERPPGTSVLDVFRALTTTVIDDFVARGDEDLLAVAKIIRRQPRAAGAPDRGVGVGGRGRSPPRSPRRQARPTTTSCPASSPARCGGRTGRSSSSRCTACWPRRTASSSSPGSGSPPTGPTTSSPAGHVAARERGRSAESVSQRGDSNRHARTEERSGGGGGGPPHVGARSTTILERSVGDVPRCAGLRPIRRDVVVEVGQQEA